MCGKQVNIQNSSGRITSDVKLQASILAIIAFVSKQLPFWRDDPGRVDEQSEPKLNSQLCDFLDCQARKDLPAFRFHHEELQVGRRSVDLSAKPVETVVIEAKPFTKYDPVIVIECKRLPAPSIDREKEYVTGTSSDKITGGIQRFKLDYHGAKHELAAMVGYIQDQGKDWLKTINNWIKELSVKPIGDGCIWANNETLDLLKSNTKTGIIECYSRHQRKNADSHEISIYHIWVSMRKTV
jgi:hypothetical protein